MSADRLVRRWLKDTGGTIPHFAMADVLREHGLDADADLMAEFGCWLERDVDLPTYEDYLIRRLGEADHLRVILDAGFHGKWQTVGISRDSPHAVAREWLRSRDLSVRPD